MLRLGSLLLLLALAIVSVSVSVHGESINFRNCADSVDVCTVDQVRVSPCPQAASNAACHIRRRRPAVMSFDFTPQFDADSLGATLGWVKDENTELPLLSLERDACKATGCPVRSGVQATYTTEVPIEAKFPLSAYTIRWALKDPASGKRCCFLIDIKVVR
ncbi:GL13990 [Drosophila persimilis]|uniref:MD-2-related lipid-recognition protein-like n=2 Tax=pseudoobscura subgroup TaxID=32358 RepID=A0A6I8ULU1_DROPS|nr:MD-2-related lipid-recognition protein [Drosophila pseudoobscura]XP_002020433.1 MD-2-related lipid-recognition protein [Drosophila persimilis]XP_017142774.1 MD-2-related lipid-recognition protein-like [Drosophila miranda]EDW39245.1 GL13990 [Drosophila persimilis]